MDNPDPIPIPKKPRGEGRGCLFYGCITTAVCFFLVIAGTVGLVHYGVKKVKGFMDDYVDTQPMKLPLADTSPAVIGPLEKRISTFSDALTAGTNTEPLVLTSSDVNSWLAQAAGTNGIKGHAFVTMENSNITAQASIPLDSVPMMNLSNKFLNGTIRLNVGLTNGRLVVMINSFEVRGKPLPPQFMAVFQSQNLANDFQEDPDNAAAIAKLESIKVENGKLIFKAKPKPQ